jgi:hypothetical protein
VLDVENATADLGQGLAVADPASVKPASWIEVFSPEAAGGGGA